MFGNIRVVNDSQLEKAPSSMTRKDDGNGPDIVKVIQPENTSFPILVIEDGNEISFNEVHPEKAQSSISRSNDDVDVDKLLSSLVVDATN